MLKAQNNCEDVDVFVVDGGSTDGTVDAVKNFFPDVNIQTKDGLYWNRGMWHAWDTAYKTSDYKYYLWLNDDTFTYPNLIKKLELAVEETKGKAIIVGATLSLNHKYKTYGAYTKKHNLLPDGTLMSADFFNGNIVMVPREIFKTIGNLDYYFIHNKGDLEYGLRALKNGFKIYQYGEYLGDCDSHDTIAKWCNPNVPLLQRLEILKHPLEMPPNEGFYLEKRYYGYSKAVFHYLTTYIRCIFPSLWFMLGKVKNRER